jgi:transcriptional regulator with XRE-family HTH domain
MNSSVQLPGLRQARIAQGFVLSDVAAATGISIASLSLIERGLRRTRPSTITLLARALEVEPEILITPDDGLEVAVGNGHGDAHVP